MSLPVANEFYFRLTVQMEGPGDKYFYDKLDTLVCFTAVISH
jgi:hypothetical protein